MVIVPPGDFAVGQQVLVHQRPVERDESERFEAQIFALCPFDPCILHQNQVLDPDAVFARLVIARLVREDHAFAQFGFGAREGAAGLGNALRAFVHREIAAHAMAGTMAVIDARLPQMHSRQHVERAAAGAIGEGREREFDMALQHARVAIHHLGGRLARADPDGAGDVGRPVEILPARIAQEDARRRDRDIAVFIDLVMRQRGMAGGGADRVEAAILQFAGRLAEFAQFGDGGQLVDIALGRFDRDPAQESRDRCAVACLGIAMALLFGRRLDRLGQDGRIGIAHDLGTARFERVENPGHCVVRIDRHGLALQLCQCGLEIRAIAHMHGIAEMLGQLGGDLVGRDEKFRRAIGMGEHVGKRDRRVRDIGPAHVEQPGNRIERGDDGGVVAFGLEPVGDFGALVRARAPGIGIVMRDGGGERGLRAIGPHRVDRIAVDRDQLDALLGEQLFRRFGPFDPVQPGIVSDPRALFGMLGDPFGRRGRRDVFVIEQVAVDLLAHLHGVAAIGEHRRAILHHDGRPGAAAEAGQPGEALGVFADIFAHMLVRNRHHEPVEPPSLQFLAQGGETGFVGLHQHGSGLAFVNSCLRQYRASNRRSPPKSLYAAQGAH